MEDLTNLLQRHLNSNNLNERSSSWRVQYSPLGGRGLFANRDIRQGEMIFVDLPLIFGPRSSQNIPFHCVVCSKKVTTVCLKGCSLPICSSYCTETSLHKVECKFIQNRKKHQGRSDISRELFQNITPIRGLFLNNKQLNLLEMLCSSESNTQNSKAGLVKLDLSLSTDESTIIQTVSSLLNTHGFEVMTDADKTNISLRGLYPIAGLMNHNCIPNTIYVFDYEKRMIVKASLPIPKNTEILTTYTPVLWGTTTRRHFLSKTKNFWCACERCKDPKEFGVGLNGFKCTSSTCDGVLYPLESLNNLTKWKCEKCKVTVSNNKIGFIQTAMGNLLGTVRISNVQALVNFVKFQLYNVAPLKSQIAVEFKCKVVWLLGNTEDYYWQELTTDNLNFKEDICKDLLQILSDLKLGQCRLRGLILMELHRSMVELTLRKTLMQCTKGTEDTQQEQRRILKEAAEILSTDMSLINTVNKLISSAN